ncbi:MAG TPA: hypothetical protein VGF75_01690 [Candidatus Saccharimonadales bacterium]
MSTTAETSRTEHQEFTIGRGGLKVPTDQWNMGFRTLSNAETFFSRLWHLNGEFKEKVFLPEKDKPLLILERQQTLRTEYVRQIGQSVIAGTDSSIRILTTPDQDGDPFKELASFRDTEYGEQLYLHGERIDVSGRAYDVFDESRTQAFADMESQFDRDVRQALGEIARVLS